MSAQSAVAGSELGKRTLIALPLVALVAVITPIGGLPFAITLVAVGAICSWELGDMAKFGIRLRLGCAAAIALMLLEVRVHGNGWLVPMSISGGVILVLVNYVSGRPSPKEMGDASLGVYWVGLCLAHAVLLRGLPHGAWLLVLVLATTFAGDTAAYLVGKKFGRHKLKRISPNKTWEGLAGGIVIAVAVMIALSQCFSWINPSQAAVLGVSVALVAPLGDLFESGIKRHYGEKDSGKLLGPHGGLLDRIDAALFAMVAGYWICQAYAL